MLKSIILRQLKGQVGPKRARRMETGALFIILLMQVEQEIAPFQIIHNARSHRGSRSRKSSSSTFDKDRNTVKTNKVRKMTMNPQSISQFVIAENDQVYERPQVKSLAGQLKEQLEDGFDFRTFLDLDPTKIQSSSEMKLQNGIWDGLVPDKELDHQFRYGQRESGIDWSQF